MEAGEHQVALIHRIVTLAHHQATGIMLVLARIAGVVATIMITRRVLVVVVPVQTVRQATVHQAIAVARQAATTTLVLVKTAGVAATPHHRRIIAAVAVRVHRRIQHRRISRGVARRLLHTTGVPKAIAAQAIQLHHKAKAARHSTVAEAVAVVGIAVAPHQAVARRVVGAHVDHANNYNFS